MKSKRQGKWDDFANVEQALMVFIAASGTPKHMPTFTELCQAGCTGLAYAIYRHGGYCAVASRLQLQGPKVMKAHGYWKQFANLEQELRAFLAASDTPDRMPTREELIQAGRSDLTNAIPRHGGYCAVASRLQLQGPKVMKAHGYWKQFANLEQELRAFLAASDTPDRMPTREELIQAGRSDLTNAIPRHGGYCAVASRLALPMKGTKPRGYWRQFANLEQELRAFLAASDTPDRMPTREELIQAGRSDLANAISRHGGYCAVASRLALLKSGKKPRGYWRQFANLEQELRAFLAVSDTPDRMPTREELIQAGRSDLTNAISRHGGYCAVASRLALLKSGKKPRGYWDDFTHVEQEVFARIKQHGTPGVMPMQSEIGHDLRGAFNRHGGILAVAGRLHLAHRTPPGYWKDFAHVEVHIRSFVTMHGTPRNIPYRKALVAAGYASLADAIERYHGGYRAVAHRLGLQTPRASRRKGQT